MHLTDVMRNFQDDFVGKGAKAALATINSVAVMSQKWEPIVDYRESY